MDRIEDFVRNHTILICTLPLIWLIFRSTIFQSFKEVAKERWEEFINKEMK